MDRSRPTRTAFRDLVGIATLAGLGAFHGLNPGMGWLFAVGVGPPGALDPRD